MTVEEVAKYLKVEESTVYTWPEQGKIRASKLAVSRDSKKKILTNG